MFRPFYFFIWGMVVSNIFFSKGLRLEILT
jgi:hypothetical protein